MKKTLFIIIIAAAMFSCKKNNNEPTAPTTPDEPKLTEKSISFENAVLDSNKVMDNVPYTEDILTFNNYYDTAYSYWAGFAISAVYNDTNPSPYENMYGSITGSAYDGNNFAVIYYDSYNCTPTISAKQDFQPQNIRINNSTYGYFDLSNGSTYSKKFETGDYFYITATGYDAKEKETGHADFYLADFRDGKTLIVRDWSIFDLTPLGTCRSIKFTFTSTDMGDWGMNTPATAIIDYITIKY